MIWSLVDLNIFPLLFCWNDHGSSWHFRTFQLAGIIPCPRHRLPRFDPKSGLLTGTNDGTLVNLFLSQFRRKTGKSLCILLLVFQAICCGFCFRLRGSSQGGINQGFGLYRHFDNFGVRTPYSERSARLVMIDCIVQQDSSMVH